MKFLFSTFIFTAFGFSVFTQASPSRKLRSYTYECESKSIRSFYMKVESTGQALKILKIEMPGYPRMQKNLEGKVLKLDEKGFEKISTMYKPYATLSSSLNVNPVVVSTDKTDRITQDSIYIVIADHPSVKYPMYFLGLQEAERRPGMVNTITHGLRCY